MGSNNLPVSRLINVDVVLTPLAAQAQDLSTLLVLGTSNVIDVLERIRTYSTLADVAADFGTTAPEYYAAVLWFGQSPQPNQLKIGRWANEDTAGFLAGGILSSAQSAISVWTAVSNGGVNFTIDGVARNLTALDFSGETNLNGVASVIDAALGSYGNCAWNGSNFTVSSSTAGAGAYASGTVTLDTNPSYGVQAFGDISFDGTTSPGDTININGTTVTFVSGTPIGNQVLIGATAADTADNFQAFAQASSDANLAECTYNTIGTVTTVTARAFGTAANAFVFTESSSDISLTPSDGSLGGGVAADTLTINGTAITFVNANASGNEVVVGPTAEMTAANLQLFLQASSDSNLNDCTYSTTDNVITVTAAAAGTAGNSITLAKSSSHVSISGANLSGGLQPSTVSFATAGAGTDISAMLAMRSTSSGAYVVDGIDAQTALETAALFDQLFGQTWYALTIPEATDDDHIAVAGYIEASDNKHLYGVSTQEAGVISSVSTTDIAYLLSQLGYNRTVTQYSSNSAYSVCSLLGRALTVNYNGNSTVITLMYKQEPGIVAENLTTTQVNALEAKNCNVFVAYNNSTSIIEKGQVASGDFIDTITGTDWLAVTIMTAVYNLLYTSPTKIPQTDAGSNLITTTIETVCGQGVANGLLAPGVWNSGGFGQLHQGDFLPKGFYVYAPPVSSQTQADREARKSVPFQIAAKLAGAVHTVDIVINISR